MGTLERGRWADFVLLDKDIAMPDDPEDIVNARVLATYLGGVSIYEAQDLAPSGTRVPVLPNSAVPDDGDAHVPGMRVVARR